MSSERNDQAAFFCNRNELGGRQQTSRRVLPPHERFHFTEPFGLKLHYGLEVHAQFVMLDREAQVCFNLQLFDLLQSGQVQCLSRSCWFSRDGMSRQANGEDAGGYRPHRER